MATEVEPDLVCPHCQSNDVEFDTSGFVEIGECNGKNYDEEYDIDRYKCCECRRMFWIESN